MSNIITRSINAIQDINRRVPGVANAPVLNEWPTSIETFELPLALTDIGRGSEWGLDCGDGVVNLSVTVSVYLQSFNQEYFGVIREQVTTLADAFRDHYRREATYLEDDGTKMLIDEDGLQAWIAQGKPMTFSGYTRLEYPAVSGKFYHGFTLTFGVNGDDGSCGEENI